MNIRITGSGKTIVLLHGYFESMAIWKDIAQLLSNRFQVVLIDLPGHGKSPYEMKTSSLEEAAHAIHKLLEENGIFEYFLIGHSLGGYVSLAMTELFPNAVSGLGLFNSTTFADDDAKKVTRDKVIRFIKENGISSFAENFIPTLFAPDNKTRFKSEIEDLKKLAANTSQEGAIGFAIAMKNRTDRTHILASLDKPVFILAGDHDPAVPLSHSQHINQIRNGESKILEDCGHMAFIEAKKESLEFVKSFMNNYLN